MIEIQRMLVLSTGHLSTATQTLLSSSNAGHPGWLPWAPQLEWCHGWLWYVDQNTGDGVDFPGEFVAIFKLAVQHDCNWIRFDEDGPRVAGLPFFDDSPPAMTPEVAWDKLKDLP